MTPLRLAVLTTGRQDWGLLRPLCEGLAGDQSFELLLIAGGMACSKAHGCVLDQILDEGFEVAAEIRWPVGDTDAAVQASRALELVAAELRRIKPDALILLGDRFETASAALAATLELVPLVHLYGGEETEGAFDNSLRHCITKLSHLHFVSHKTYARRVIQMGEHPQRVHVVGSLGVDNALNARKSSRVELEARLGIQLKHPVGVVTLHPTTLARSSDPVELHAVIAAIESFPATWIVTLPNADPGGEAIRNAFLSLAERQPNVVAVSALGDKHYLGLVGLADFVLGNSSSGMTEAPAFRVPTINVGDRQRGRLRCASILDVPPEAADVLAAVEHCLTPEFRRIVDDMPQLFWGVSAVARILAILRAWRPPEPPRKVFADLPVVGKEVG